MIEKFILPSRIRKPEQSSFASSLEKLHFQPSPKQTITSRSNSLTFNPAQNVGRQVQSVGKSQFPTKISFNYSNNTQKLEQIQLRKVNATHRKPMYPFLAPSSHISTPSANSSNLNAQPIRLRPKGVDILQHSKILNQKIELERSQYIIQDKSAQNKDKKRQSKQISLPQNRVIEDLMKQLATCRQEIKKKQKQNANLQQYINELNRKISAKQRVSIDLTQESSEKDASLELQKKAFQVELKKITNSQTLSKMRISDLQKKLANAKTQNIQKNKEIAKLKNILKEKGF